MAINDTPMSSFTTIKLILVSGQFTSTVKTSQSVSAIDSILRGMDWDGTNTPWVGSSSDKLFYTSGQFTSTLKDSQSVGGVDIFPEDITTDLTDTPWIGRANDKLYLQSGKVTSTIKTSQVIIDNNGEGISFDGTNTPWVGDDANKLYLQSGEFSSTIKTSEGVGGISAQPHGISHDGTNTPWSGIFPNDKLYLTSGQFTSVVKTSVSLPANPDPFGISTNDIDSRLPSPDNTGDSDIELPILHISNNIIQLPILTVVALELGANLNGAVGIALPVFIVSGLVSGDIDSDITFPIISLSARAYNGSAPECVVMNTRNFAVTEYVNYGFNSMTRFNGAELIADQNGIYEQDGSDTDNASVDDYAIKAHIKSGRIDIHKGSINRLRNAWLNYQTDGSVQMVTRADKKATRYYMMPYRSALEGINERRVKLERGIRNRFFDFKIQNIIGSQLEIDKLTITLEPIVSKRR